MQVVAVATTLGTVVHMEVARANAQVRHVIGHLATNIEGHAPIKGFNFLSPDLARAARVLAARQAQRSQGLRPADHVLDGTDLLHMPVVHHTDALAQATCLIDIVAHVQHGAVADIEQVEHVLLKRALEIRIECAHGLVEHEDARVRRHHAGKRHTLLLAARKSRGIAVGKVGQAKDTQIAFGKLFARCGVAGILNAGTNVIGNRHIGKQLIVLEQQGALAFLGRQVDARGRVEEGHAIDDDLALIGRLHAGDAAQGTALTASGGAKQRHPLLAGFQLNVEGKAGITLFDIQNERHGLSTSLRDRVVTHKLGQRLAIDTQGIATDGVERIALTDKLLGLFALRAGETPLAVLLRMRRVHVDE